MANVDEDAAMRASEARAELKRMEIEEKEHQAQVKRLTAVVEANEREAKASKAETANYRRDAVIREAASKVGFYDVSQVTKLTRDNVSVDDQGRVEVVDDTGNRQLSFRTMEPLQIEEFYADFATKNPHLVKASTRGGSAGSHPFSNATNTSNTEFKYTQVFGNSPDYNGGLAQKLYNTNRAEYDRLRAQAVKAGLFTK